MIEAFGNQQHSVASFCAERGVKFHTFRYWQKIFEQQSAPSTEAVSSNCPVFREISICPPSSASSQYSILLRNGRTLSIGASFAESDLRKLIEILESC